MTFRQALWCVFFLGLVCSAASLFAQYGMGLNPCVLCIVQRVAVMTTALVALLCALWPDTRAPWRILKAMVVSAAPLWGLSVALYQIYIQSLPMMQQPSCGAPWTFRLHDAPLFQWYEPIIRGTGNCGEVQRVFGVSLPLWSALFFSAVLLWTWVMWWRSRRA